ncbi:hypothetical protein G6M26_23410 [Agrobacterium tumefaciens]|nr:hypothetical protein [Agrobacterium tumefaciens]NTE21492.1 hypothetical protein [Agrobacterium tumefaciens]
MKQVNDNNGCLGFLFAFTLGLPIMGIIYFGQQFYISYLRLFKGLTVRRHKTSYYDFGELRISQPKNNSEKQDNQFLGGALLIPIGGLIAYVILAIIYAQIEKALR